MTDKEIALVRDVRPADPRSDPAVKARAWARLHAEFEAADATGAAKTAPGHRRSSRRRFAWPLATAGVVAAGVATAILVAQAGGTAPAKSPQSGGTARTKSAQAEPTSSLPTLELAAMTVAHQTLAVPRPDQWVYTRMITESDVAPGGKPVTIERWEQYGATRTAIIDRRTGKLKVTYDAEAARATEDMKLPEFVKYVNGLPTDSKALLSRIRADSKSKLFVSTVGNGDVDGPVFQSINLIFTRDPFIPPKVNAALFRMLGEFPGVHIEKQARDAAGRKTVGVYRDSPGEDRTEILFDPTTFRYMGSRNTAVQDFTSDAKPKLIVKAGQVLFQTAVITSKVTDKPGQR